MDGIYAGERFPVLNNEKKCPDLKSFSSHEEWRSEGEAQKVIPWQLQKADKRITRHI